MAAIRLEQKELEALAGLTDHAFRLYIVLRRFMDYATGLVGGPKRRVSWQNLAEEMYVDPAPGVQGTGTPTKARIRRAARLLERNGLVENLSEGKLLVFRLPLAATDTFIQNQADTRPTYPQPPQADIPEPASCGGSDGQADTRPTYPQTLQADTPPVSGNTNYTTPSRAHARSNPRADDVPETPQAWQQLFVNELGYDFRQAMTAKVAAMYRRWTDAGVTAQDVRDAAAVAASQGKDRPAPTYFADMAMEIHEEKQKTPGDRAIAGGANSQITSVGGTQNGPRHPRNQPRSAIDRVLANAQAAWESGEFDPFE